MIRFDTKPLKLGCGMVIGLCSILTIVFLILAVLTFGISSSNYHGNLMVMMFFSIVGLVIPRLLIKSASTPLVITAIAGLLIPSFLESGNRGCLDLATTLDWMPACAGMT